MLEYSYNIGLRFRSVAAEAGERPALIHADGSTTSYEALNVLANQVAHTLLRRGIKGRDVLGIVHDKGAISFAVMLAALKLGVAYVNIDDQNPPARLSHIFSSAKPRFVFGVHLADSVRIASAAAGAVLLPADELRGAILSAPSWEPDSVEKVTGADPAYIMYTSGSTGVPKGAMMTHGNVLNFGHWIASRFGIGATDIMTSVNPMYFDNSVFDFYGAMLNGAGLAPVTREALSDPAAMLRQVEAAKCTLWFSVPSMLVFLMTMKLLTADRLPSIRAFVFGGEGYPKPELRKLFGLYAKRSKLINVYGPTECTCMCSAYDVTAADLEDPNGLVTLGPIAENFSMLVLDGDKAVSVGEVGELCLLGPQVGLGYANDPERTSRAFVQNPYEHRFAEKMYRTGDLVRLGADATLDFVGRKDNQVKHMGYRIELEEIESGINQIPGVVQSAVLQKTARRGGMKVLVAYVSTDADTNEAALRSALEDYLPPYMIPQRFDVRASLPKNANGKIDKVALAGEDD